MSSEKELRSFILSRFFLVLAIVTVVELIVVYLTNSFILPAVIKKLNFDMLFSIKSVERFILISFVIIVALIINKILPIFKVSPSSITPSPQRAARQFVRHAPGASSLFPET